MPPRVLIFGSGAVGATYGYILSKAITADNITAVCRSNYDAALTNGFTIHSTFWGRDQNYRPHIVRSPSEAICLAPFDYIIITSKILPQAPSIPELLRPIVSLNTAIVLIQNGINIETPYSTVFPSNPILTCTTYLPVTQVSPGVIEHKHLEHLHIGTYPANDVPARHKEAAHSFAALIHAGAASATVHDDIQRERWTKLIANAAWNPICALTCSRDVQFLHASPHAAAYIRSLMLEVAAVATSEGYPIGDETVDMMVERSMQRDLPGVEPSMMADALAGRAMEVDAIVGNTVEVAEKRGVDAPLLKGVYAMIKALDQSMERERDKEL